mgnify:CR=1 FL=1
MQKAYQKNEHEIYLENEAGERIAEILFPAEEVGHLAARMPGHS